MWRLVTSSRQRFRVTALVFLRHYRHQMALGSTIMMFVIPPAFVCSSSCSNLVPLLFSISLFLIQIFSTLFSSSTFFLLFCLYFFSSCSLANFLLLSLNPPLLVSFSLFFLLSWFCAHALFLKSGGESHCGKFPACCLLCGSLVSHRWRSKLDCIYDTCVPQNSCTKKQNSPVRIN